MDANRFRFEDFGAFISWRLSCRRWRGLRGLESVPIRHCSCKLACYAVRVSSFRLPLPFSAPVAIIATTGHVRRTSFLADVQLVRKCFSNGTEALPGGRHLRVLSVERSTANATETLALVHFDVAPTVYIRTGSYMRLNKLGLHVVPPALFYGFLSVQSDRRCPQARSFDICVPLNRNGACVLTCTLVMVLVLTIGGSELINLLLLVIFCVQ